MKKDFGYSWQDHRRMHFYPDRILFLSLWGELVTKDLNTYSEETLLKNYDFLSVNNFRLVYGCNEPPRPSYPSFRLHTRLQRILWALL